MWKHGLQLVKQPMARNNNYLFIIADKPVLLFCRTGFLFLLHFIAIKSDCFYCCKRNRSYTTKKLFLTTISFAACYLLYLILSSFKFCFIRLFQTAVYSLPHWSFHFYHPKKQLYETSTICLPVSIVSPADNSKQHSTEKTNDMDLFFRKSKRVCKKREHTHDEY